MRISYELYVCLDYFRKVYIIIIEFFVNSCVLSIFLKDKILIAKSSINIREKLFIGMAGGLLEV